MTLQFKNASETELMNRRKKSVFVKLNDNQEVIEEKCYIPHKTSVPVNTFFELGQRFPANLVFVYRHQKNTGQTLCIDLY